MRASATAIRAFSGANTANSGANSVVNVCDRSSSAIRAGIQALLLVGTRSPSRRTSALASAMSRVRVGTSASRLSVLVRRDRLAYIGASFGSATITSGPSDSR